jgi:hypothetical protein
MSDADRYPVGEAVGESWGDEPGEHRHRERGGCPDGEDPADPQLRNLDTRGGSVGAGSGRWKCVVHLDHPLLLDSIPRR